MGLKRRTSSFEVHPQFPANIYAFTSNTGAPAQAVNDCCQLGDPCMLYTSSIMQALLCVIKLVMKTSLRALTLFYMLYFCRCVHGRLLQQYPHRQPQPRQRRTTPSPRSWSSTHPVWRPQRQCIALCRRSTQRSPPSRRMRVPPRVWSGGGRCFLWWQCCRRCSRGISQRLWPSCKQRAAPRSRRASPKRARGNGSRAGRAPRYLRNLKCKRAGPANQSLYD